MTKYTHESFDGWWYTEGMKPIQILALPPMQHNALERLYRTTKDPRLRTRAQMILLSVEQGLKVPQIAAIVRQSEAMVLRWLKRYLAEGLEGLLEVPDRLTMRRAPLALAPSLFGVEDGLVPHFPLQRGLSAHVAHRRAPTATKLRVTVLVMDVAASGRLLGRTDRPSSLR